MQPASATPHTWTTLSLIQWSTDHLAGNGIDEARLHAELLLAHALRLTRTGIAMHSERRITSDELADFTSLLRRRMSREPLQYIVGETEFMGLPLFVNRDVLIPRPETELLVEKALELLRTIDKEHPEVLDCGTGSGNIPIAIARFAPAADITSIDASERALETAQRNIRRNRAGSIRLHHADMFSDFLPGRAFDMIVANPPYIGVEEFGSLEPELQFEPRMALTDEGDGLRFIRRIGDIAMAKLRTPGWLLIEISHGQSEQVRALLAACGLTVSDVVNDYAGIPRVAVARHS